MIDILYTIFWVCVGACLGVGGLEGNDRSITGGQMSDDLEVLKRKLLRRYNAPGHELVNDDGPAAVAAIERLTAEVAALRVTQERQNSDTMLLRQCYVTLAFAFYRLHESARSRDGELCLDFQRVRALIEKRFREIGIKL